jgi:hypothetical protein
VHCLRKLFAGVVNALAKDLTTKRRGCGSIGTSARLVRRVNKAMKKVCEGLHPNLVCADSNLSEEMQGAAFPMNRWEIITNVILHPT